MKSSTQRNRNRRRNELDVVQSNAASLHHVNETPGRGNENVAAALNVLQLADNISASVHNTGARLGSVGKLHTSEHR